MTGETDPIGEPEDEIDATEEVVDGLPVLAGDPRVIETVAPVSVPTRHAAALAATGFVAGAATVAIVHRRRTAKVPRRRKKKGGPVADILASNSFLVDVHLLRRD